MQIFIWGKKHYPEVLRFLLIGGSATLLDLLIFRLLLIGLPHSVNACYVIAFTISVVCRFYADKYYTFKERSSKNKSTQFLSYLLSCLATMSIGILFLNFFLLLNLSPFWSKVFSIPFVTVAGYFLFKFFVFKKINK